MIWSVSNEKTFKRCQRQWYYGKVFANSRSQDPLRQEAHRLKRLVSLQAWRGKLVDEVISKALIPAVSKKRTIRLSQIKELARQTFDEQWKVASGQSADSSEYELALHPLAYGKSVSEAELDLLGRK